jgi:type III secretion system (T3SS) SseB-like protein
MFNPENDLERSLDQAFADPARRTEFLKRFMDAELVFGLVDSGDPREGYVVPEVTHDDLSFVPIFTAESRVKAMFGDEQLMIVRQSFRQILEQIEDANFVLNPGSERGREFTTEDVAALLAGDFSRAAEGFEDGFGEEGDETPTLVGMPQPMPTHLTAPLAALFANIPEVRAAHIAQAISPDSSGARRLVIGLAADGDVDALFDRIEAVLETAAKPTDVIDFVAVPGSPLDAYFERDTQPFYRKA